MSGSARVLGALARDICDCSTAKKWVRRLVLPMLTVLAVAGLVACGDDADDLSASAVEDDVRTAIRSGGFEADAIGDVSCPSGEPRDDGHSFECTATVDGQDVTVKIDQDDGVQVATAVYETGSVENQVESEFDENTGTAVSASCSSEGAIVVDVGRTFECTVEDREGATQAVTVTSQTAGAYLVDTPPFPGT